MCGCSSELEGINLFLSIKLLRSVTALTFLAMSSTSASLMAHVLIAGNLTACENTR